jgi:hypothetical protein
MAEVDLIRAALDDAVDLASGRSVGVRRDVIQLRQWLNDTEHDGLFSFIGVCRALGVESVERVRSHLLASLDNHQFHCWPADSFERKLYDLRQRMRWWTCPAEVKEPALLALSELIVLYGIREMSRYGESL